MTEQTATVGQEYPLLALPKDSEGYIVAFGLDEEKEYLAFFESHGFVVVKDVLKKDECVASVKGIWSFLEGLYKNEPVNSNDPSTWRTFPGAFQAGLLSQALSIEAWKNRTKPEIYNLFKTLTKKEDLWVSIDNWGFMRPTKDVPQGVLLPQDPTRVDVASVPEGVETVDKPDWKTKSRWLHWDLNPFMWAGKSQGLDYEFLGDFISENNGSKNNGELKLQGLVNLIDCKEEDGGFCIVPGFHKHIEEWVTQPHLSEYKQKHIEVSANDPMQAQVQKIPARAGSMIIWRGEMPHCNDPNSSNKFRMVQYIKMFGAQKNGPGTDLRKSLLEAHAPSEIKENPLARRLLGLDDY